MNGFVGFFTVYIFLLCLLVIGLFLALPEIAPDEDEGNL